MGVIEPKNWRSFFQIIGNIPLAEHRTVSVIYNRKQFGILKREVILRVTQGTADDDFNK
jgi:hypothetical protein